MSFTKGKSMLKKNNAENVALPPKVPSTTELSRKQAWRAARDVFIDDLDNSLRKVMQADKDIPYRTVYPNLSTYGKTQDDIVDVRVPVEQIHNGKIYEYGKYGKYLPY